MGIVKTKFVARSCACCPEIDSVIENVTESCENCREIKSNPALAELKV